MFKKICFISVLFLGVACEPAGKSVAIEDLSSPQDLSGAQDLSSDPDAPCVPTCTGVECGDDGCGGSCGSCESGFACNEWGQCLSTCVPDCSGKTCGDNGCGSTCGNCPSPWVCLAFSCCMPQCDDAVCGDDGCGRTCGSCEAGQVCVDGACCTQLCGGLECGSDGCGGSCGACDAGWTCKEGLCECVPSCLGRECGSDGCGGSCGSCDAGQDCTGGHCDCTPDCVGKECGDDGCAATCGLCQSECVCDTTGQCKGEDGVYQNLCNGAMLDPASNLYWRQSTLPSMTWDAAKSFCEASEIGGYTDWRLPTIEELRSLISGCPATETGGACPALDSCTSSNCLTTACNGCGLNQGPGSSGLYIDDALAVPVDSHFWSATRLNLAETPAFTVEFDSGRVNVAVTTVTLKTVRCVRP